MSTEADKVPIGNAASGDGGEEQGGGDAESSLQKCSLIVVTENKENEQASSPVTVTENKENEQAGAATENKEPEQAGAATENKEPEQAGAATKSKKNNKAAAMLRIRNSQKKVKGKKTKKPYNRQFGKGIIVESPTTNDEGKLKQSGKDVEQPATSTPTNEAKVGRKKLGFPEGKPGRNDEDSLLDISSIIANVGSPTPPSARCSSFSFEEKFKYKVSMYSKVQGCRLTNIPDFIIVKQVRATILQKIVRGIPSDAIKVKFAYEKMKNGGLQIITDDRRLSLALGELDYFCAVPVKVTYPDTPRVVGFVKNLPIGLDPAEVKKEIRKRLPEVYSVRYINEKSPFAPSRNNGLYSYYPQGPAAFVSFNLKFLPGTAYVYGRPYELHVPHPMQCAKCQKFGHQGKQCTASTKCSYCSSSHSKQYCKTQYFRCVNCNGPHPSTSHDCFLWKQGKLMNELRYRGGFTAEEAIFIATDGKIQHKKHSFTFPVEYFDNQEIFFLENTKDSDDLDDFNFAVDEQQNIVPQELDELDDPPPTLFHLRFIRAQQFLDTITDLYLKLAHPGKNYTSACLMPGFEDSMMERVQPEPVGPKRPSKVAEQFKFNVIQAVLGEANGNAVGQNEETPDHEPPPKRSVSQAFKEAILLSLQDS